MKSANVTFNDMACITEHDERTDVRTDARTTRKQYAPQLLRSWGWVHKNPGSAIITIRSQSLTRRGKKKERKETICNV